MQKHKILKCLRVIMGGTILSFGIYNIHQQVGITEGGILGMILLFKEWLNISPSISSIVLDSICYIIAFLVLGKVFAKYSLLSTFTFATTLAIWKSFPPVIPNIAAYPLLAAILGAIFVGIGSGMVVKEGGACNGDDALAMIISKFSKLPIGICYLLTDISVLFLSLTYIPPKNILYSLITVTISSFLLGKIVEANII